MSVHHCFFAILAVSLAGASQAQAADGPLVAIVHDEPGNCIPLCREGFMCHKGRCVSLCNPPCSPTQECIEGDCQPIPKPGRPARREYFALLAGYSPALSNSASGTADLRVEFAGPYIALQIGPAFGDGLLALRTAFMGHVAIQLTPTLPLFAVPTVHLGYAFHWLDDANETRQQDLFVTPGLRVRYDFHPRLSLLVDLLQVEITFLRLQSDRNSDYSRVTDVPVKWGLQTGIGLLY